MFSPAQGHLYLLVTDQGFLQEEQVVWESLHNVDVNKCFLSSVSYSSKLLSLRRGRWDAVVLHTSWDLDVERRVGGRE